VGLRCCGGVRADHAALGNCVTDAPGHAHDIAYRRHLYPLVALKASPAVGVTKLFVFDPGCAESDVVVINIETGHRILPGTHAESKFLETADKVGIGC